jgi:magnesium-transporting ATPase (P-type)
LKTLKNISFFVILGGVINYLCAILKSSYLTNFLNENIILIFIPLLAINITTSSFIIGKLSDITEKYGTNFTNTYKELKTALFEQLILIIIAIVCLIVKNSCYFIQLGSNYMFIADSLLIGAFIYNIDILRDTGISIFQIFETLEQLKKDKK